MNSYDEIQCEELNEIDAYDQMMWVEAMEAHASDWAEQDGIDHQLWIESMENDGQYDEVF